jgi:hypothetical protein
MGRRGQTKDPTLSQPGWGGPLQGMKQPDP